MHKTPNQHEQIARMVNYFQQQGISVTDEQALHAIATALGYAKPSDYVATFMQVNAGVGPKPGLALVGPADGRIYQALVTVDVTESAMVRVRAYNEEEAEGLFPEAAQLQYPHGFELDDNAPDLSKFYLGDPEAIFEDYPLEVYGDSFSADATWTDSGRNYRIQASRDEPDNADDDMRAAVSLMLTITDATGKSVTNELNEFTVHDDSLSVWLEEAIGEGDFESHFEELLKNLTA